MQLAFITSFSVQNDTPNALRMTPIGSYGREASKVYKGPLPTYSLPIPAVPGLRQGNFHIRPGETAFIFYDWDDIQLSELVIETPSKSLRQMVVDTCPADHYYSPRTDTFVVSSIDSLPEVSAEVLIGYKLASGIKGINPMLMFYIVCLIPLATLPAVNKLHQKYWQKQDGKE